MKKITAEFCRKGLVAGGFGPLVLVALYGILDSQGLLQTLTPGQVCLGIVSLWGLAFVAGGMNVVYQIERLPLAVAILIHGSVLYGSYLVTYLINGWLEQGPVPILVFSGIFLFGYLSIWAVIYSVTIRRTRRLNRLLKQKHRSADTI